MKFISFFTLFACLVALSSAAPIPGPTDGDKGKGKQASTPSPPPSPPPGSESSWSSSRAQTPTPADDHNVPLPGRSGVHHDAKTGITTAFYGDDQIPEHMGHLQRNQEQHRGNRRPMPLASDAEHTHNRNEALRGIPSGGKYRNTNEEAHRDEKTLAMLANTKHSTTTTVEKLPEGESHKEGGLTSHLKSEMEAHGSKGQIRANPGWLTPSPHQRIAHEAPARVPEHAHTHRDPDPNAPTKKMTKSKPDPAVLEAEAKKKAAGYTPTVGTSGMSLRHRPGVAAPPPPIKKEPKHPGAGTNFSPGRVSPPGHLWHPNAHGATHAGAPAPVAQAHSDSRHPSRPQDHDHYMRQQHAAHAATQAAMQHPHVPPAHPHPGPTSHSPAHNTEHFRNNLATFNAAHPPHPLAPGAHHAEAPGHLQHTPPAAHQNAPVGSHQATLPIHPAPPHQGSSSSGKKTGKK